MKYIDSSAFVKYYSEESSEKGSDKVKEIIDRAKEGKETLVSSVLLIGEVISAFDKWVRMRLIKKEEFDEIIGVFVSDLRKLADKNSIILEDITSISMIFCVDYIVKHHLTVNDSSHLYSALVHKNSIKEFVCSDMNLINAAKKEGFKIMNPEQ